MTNSKIITLQEKKDELHKILENYSQWSQVEIWIAGTAPIMREYFPNHLEKFTEYCRQPKLLTIPSDRPTATYNYALDQNEYYTPDLATINIRRKTNKEREQNAIKKLLNFLDTLIQQFNSSELISNNSEDILTILEKIFSRFHRINLKLQNRHDNRPTIKIDDEYDVQDLLHALLTLYFDDIRSEEFTNSSAGRNSRIDFLLKREKVMIEVKKTRQGLQDRKLGDEIKIDISSYKYPEASTLVFFVYDPDALIQNANAIIDDLENLSKEELSVRVFIYPRH
jgi:hypothetical protein